MGIYAITTVGIINNADALLDKYFSDRSRQFMATSAGKVNSTEMVAALINEEDDIVSGILHAQDVIEGSVTILLLTDKGEIIAARDKMGRLPVIIGKK